MADQAKCPIHDSTECFKPALDAFIQKAYDGYCTKIDWPFVRIIPKDYKRVLLAMERVKSQGLSGDEAIMAAFEENARDLSRVGGN